MPSMFCKYHRGIRKGPTPPHSPTTVPVTRSRSIFLYTHARACWVQDTAGTHSQVHHGSEPAQWHVTQHTHLCSCTWGFKKYLEACCTQSPTCIAHAGQSTGPCPGLAHWGLILLSNSCTLFYIGSRANHLSRSPTDGHAGCFQIFTWQTKPRWTTLHTYPYLTGQTAGQGYEQLKFDRYQKLFQKKLWWLPPPTHFMRMPISLHQAGQE